MDFLSFIGSLCSIIGIVITSLQVKKVRSVAEATKEATEKTQEDVSKTLSIVQVAKYCESILPIQQAVRENEIKLAIHLCHELKSALIELQANFETYHSDNIACNVTEHIKSLGINMRNMHKSLHDSKSKLKNDKIIQDLENLHNKMSEIQAIIKLNGKY